MGRPKAVSFEKFNQYDKLHTEKSKMMCGVEQTTLYPIKQTAQYYRSIEVWAYSASTFKRKIKNLTLNVDIPILTDENAVEFLNRRCWRDYVAKKSERNPDIMEAVTLLKKLFPDKEMLYFYELDGILSSYCSGDFLSYDRDGNIEEPREHNIESRKYLINKYKKYTDRKDGEYSGPADDLNRVHEMKLVIKAFDKYMANQNGDDSQKLYNAYSDLEEAYMYKYQDMTDSFLKVGQHSVCYPVAFSSGTADWHKEKYGTTCSYAHAGEIMFVATENEVFFQIKRHF